MLLAFIISTKPYKKYHVVLVVFPARSNPLVFMFPYFCNNLASVHIYVSRQKCVCFDLRSHFIICFNGDNLIMLDAFWTGDRELHVIGFHNIIPSIATRATITIIPQTDNLSNTFLEFFENMSFIYL